MHTQQPSTSVPIVPLAGRPAGQWSAIGAIAFAVAVMGLAVGAALTVQTGYALWHTSLDPVLAERVLAPNDPRFLLVVQLGGQLLELALCWWLAGLWHRDRMAALGLTPARLTASQWIGAVVLLFAVKVAATMLANVVAPPDRHGELGPFVELVRSPDTWLLFLTAVVLAGLTEELIFRGVLSRTLEATRLGFWGGAAIASAGFAALHMQYGLGGQVVIFAVGMTLAWIRSRSGSLWPAIVCHSLNNAVALLAMRALG
ncbi:MAG: lysostaphin resistance A-like protein [Hyphomicrobiaceae bacterium]